MSFTSTNSLLVLDATLGGGTVSCPTAELTVTTDDAGTAASGRVTFSGNAAARTTCTFVSTGDSIVRACPGIVGFSDTTVTSVRGTNTSADLVLLGSPVCSVTNLVTGVTINWDSQTASSCVTVRENTTIDVRCTIRITVRAARLSATATVSGTFTSASNFSIS